MTELKKEDKKGGIWASLLNLFGRGASASGGAAGLGSAGSGLGSVGSGLGAASGLGGLFATKAGILGMVLGGATIAAGVGVVYNFIGPSSKPAYTPQLFQDIYYEEQSQKASLERAQQKEGAAASASTLDMFIEQAKKEGLDAQTGAAGESKNASVEDAAAGAQAEDAGAGGGSANAAANAPAGGGARLQVSAGFGGAKGGGGGGSSTKLTGGGGMFGGINGQFTPVYRPPAGQGAQGKSSGMKGSLASAVRNSPKQVVPNFNRKGALGQARAAKSLGARAVNAPSMVVAQTDATRAFSGETVGSGEIGSAGGGVGLGGSGISSGNKLKGSDPSLNSNDSKPAPPVDPPVEESPWKKYTDMAMYAMLASAVLIVLTGVLSKTFYLYALAVATAYAAIAAALVVIFAGYMLMTKYGQKWTGIMYMAAGVMLVMKAYKALCSVGVDAATNLQLTESLAQFIPGT